MTVLLPFRLACLCGLLMFAGPGASFAAAGPLPSTFGTTVGGALLCQDKVDPYYFWSYLDKFVGSPYKSEGGAYWFKVQGSLWGAEITDVLVSDGQAEQVFLAAQFKGAPARLADAIFAASGIRYARTGTAADSPLASSLGGRIVFAGSNARIYCSHYNLDYARTHPH